MPFLNEMFTQRSSTTEEYDRLYESDNLYVAWAKSREDEKVTAFANAIDPECYTWQQKLVGEAKSKSKLQNDTMEGPVQGHIFSVSKNQINLFEKVALMPSMKYGYRFEKYDINDLKEKEKQEMLDVLKQEDQ
jgi:hypothetical protein